MHYDEMTGPPLAGSNQKPLSIPSGEFVQEAFMSEEISHGEAEEDECAKRQVPPHGGEQPAEAHHPVFDGPGELVTRHEDPTRSATGSCG